MLTRMGKQQQISGSEGSSRLKAKEKRDDTAIVRSAVTVADSIVINYPWHQPLAQV